MQQIYETNSYNFDTKEQWGGQQISALHHHDHHHHQLFYEGISKTQQKQKNEYTHKMVARNTSHNNIPVYASRNKP